MAPVHTRRLHAPSPPTAAHKLLPKVIAERSVLHGRENVVFERWSRASIIEIITISATVALCIRRKCGSEIDHLSMSRLSESLMY